MKLNERDWDSGDMDKKIGRVINGLVSILSIVFLGFMANAVFVARSELADAEKAIDSYIDYQKTKSDAALVSLKGFAEQYAISAYMVQAIVASNGDLKQRDEIMLKSMDSMVDTELYMFLKYNENLFIDSEKAAEQLFLSNLKDESVREKALNRLNTSFSESELGRIRACHVKLSEIYGGEGYSFIFYKVVVSALGEQHACKQGA